MLELSTRPQKVTVNKTDILEINPEDIQSHRNGGDGG